MTVVTLPLTPGAEVEYRGFWLKRRADRQIDVTLGSLTMKCVTIPHAIATVDRFHRAI